MEASQSTSQSERKEVSGNPPAKKGTGKPHKRRKQASSGRSPQKNKSVEQKKTPWNISQFDVPPKEDQTRFHDLDIPEVIMHAIHDLGFQYCSPIQAQILPHTLQGLDAIGKAQTGTGKTAAFLITIIDDIIKHPFEHEVFLAEPRALIIAPTRELVMQIASDAEQLCKYTKLNVTLLIGGMDYHKQKERLNRGLSDIVVATPGRLIDFMTRGDIFLDRVESLVLDEADRMLDMGFIPQVKRIVRSTPRSEFRQTQLYSATFDQDILNLIKQWTYEPVTVEIEPENIATDTVDQKVYLVSEEDKLGLLINILKSSEVERVIIFTNRRDQTQRLYEKIIAAGLNAGMLSGEVQQNKRTRTLESFKTGRIQALVATDVVGRGIHVDGVTHVINYNLPEDPEDYVHRIGRTGRAGAQGISISLACEEDAFQIPAIETLLGNKLDCVYPDEKLLG